MSIGECSTLVRKVFEDECVTTARYGFSSGADLSEQSSLHQQMLDILDFFFCFYLFIPVRIWVLCCSLTII